MKKDKKITCLLSATICLTLIACILYPTRSLKNASVTSETAKLVANVDSTKNILYLSDLDYITDNNWSYNGWNGHSIQKDKNQDGGAIGLIINGETRTFPKGLSVHAKGQVTFDISEYSNKLTRFIAKIGLDASKKTNGSIWFQIYVSNDGSKWTSLLKTGTMTGTTEAVDVDLNVEGYKYLRIYVDPVGDISSDHGSIMNARLVTKDYESKDVFYDRVHKVEYYDEILKEHDTEFNYKNNYKLILEREFVNKLGYWSIQNLAEVTTEVTEAYDWILSENRVLEEIIEVGEISNGTAFLKVLTDLYNNYKDDLATENGYVYEKMMVGLAAAYSTDRIYSPLSFSFQSPTYDYVERFGIMKDLFDNNKFKRVKINALAGEFVVNDWFRNYHVELMRMVMQDGTNNGDLIWLNGFTNEKQSVNFHMINYVSPVYTQDKYYDEANKEKYNQQFYLTKYGVPYGLVNGTKIPRYWMVFANGGICWNASRVGQSMYRVNGIPATGAYQPGHELYIQYYEDSNGNGYWTPRYGNWGQAGSTWGGGNPYRYIFNWGGKYFTDKHISGSKGATSTGYLYLAQANLNRYTDYKKSLYYNLNANSYTDDEQKLSSYFKALEVNNINLDSYDAIITLYKKMSVKNEGGTITSNDWHALANKIIEAYTYYPVAMFDLLKIIRPYLDGSDRLDIDRLEKEALTKATNATADVTNSVDGTRTHARQLLGKTQPDPISFSFDGENGGKIVKNPTYQLAWGYSLDGGKTFTKYKTDDSVTLTTEELASITEENDIIINFMGLSYTFKIDITKGTLSNLLFANDLENRVVGIDLTYEWRNNEGDSWTSYKSASPDNTGNKTLYVRKGSTGRQLASDSITYTFTADNQVNTRKYIPVSHLSIESYSTQSVDSARPFYASNAIDGNGNTLWHTDFRENVLNNEVKPFITIKLDKPRYISAVEFKQLRYRTVDPHFIKNARVYVSEDGKNWTEAGKIENCPQDNELRNITFKESIYGEYVKIEMDTYDMFASLSLINIFHDTTKNPRPTAGIGYSITGPTTENVIARLVNVSVEKYEILSPGGNTHEFTDNGEFTFRFIDKDTGIEGTATAKVNWIDREAPTADIEYSSNKATNGTVIATLKPSEDIKVINNGYYQIDEDSKVYDKDGVLLDDYVVDEDGIVKDITGRVIDPLKYEFIDNGEFVFEFVDRAGNKGTAKAKVGFIDREIPIATIKYDVESLTNKNVTASITFNEENVIVTNNDGKTNCIFTKNGEFRFDFQDVAGNNGTIIAKVDWIDKEAPTAELKYEKYNNKVIVEVVNPSKEITFKEGNGVYEYTKSGNYEIVFYDLLGNVGKLVAKIELPKEEIKNENKPNNPDVSKPSIPEDNSQINSDKPTTDQSGINPDDNNKPNDNNTNNNYNENNSINNSNNTNYSNSNNSINDNYNISNNNNENRNDNSTKENLDNTIDGENRDKLNTNSNAIKEENNVTYAKEQKVGMSKVILGGVITAIFLLALCLYIIKIIVKK